MSSSRIIYASHSDTPPRVPARLAALRFVLDCYAKKSGRLPDKNGRADAILRSAEEVGDVERRPDRPSEMT